MNVRPLNTNTAYTLLFVLLVFIAGIVVPTCVPIESHGIARAICWFLTMVVVGLAMGGQLFLLMERAGLPNRKLTREEQREWVRSGEFWSGILIILVAFGTLALRHP